MFSVFSRPQEFQIFHSFFLSALFRCFEKSVDSLRWHHHQQRQRDLLKLKRESCGILT